MRARLEVGGGRQGLMRYDSADLSTLALIGRLHSVPTDFAGWFSTSVERVRYPHL